MRRKTCPSSCRIEIKEEILENKQKTYEELLEKFILWASTNENIRLTLIIGSRACKTFPADEWSDLDLLIVTNNPDEILLSNDWLGNIGIPKIAYLEDTPVGNSKERRVLFDNGLDIDFPVFSCQNLKRL